ncbi:MULTISPECIES: hypothetical protein [unclassified Pseudomonas]|uniref:hypothetical protein n=1 Tax=unclassified Pseudomonas TaxID=196821 RepID=UPI00244AF483|nr:MULTISPECIES: hypothetical protein [unclassified Pseudomonas]MDH0300616.1 hypothetical protein [Pseudomonas sp. GD04091]MDH1984233.1 hypothetical protein [Pseudomonas sp. GD03689]
MSAGFSSYRQDGSVLYDTSKVSYGLLKSGYLSLVTAWPRLFFRSMQLDPNDPASWYEGTAEPVYGFSVSGAVAPIVFIAGSGSQCGSSKVGDVTTFYYISATPSTKFYCFDTMRDSGPITGFKVWREDGVLTFNSNQRPLNIAGVATAPEPGPIVVSDTNYRGTPYVGGVGSWGPISPDGPHNIINRVFVPISGSEEYAAYVNFTRTAGKGPTQGYYQYLVALQEGAYGVAGGVEFMFCFAARTTNLPAQRAPVRLGALYFDVPTDRYPVALAIKTSGYPFPFN